MPKKIFIGVVINVVILLNLEAQNLTGAHACALGKIQTFKQSIQNAKVSNHSKIKIDTTIDVSYYKLDLNLSYLFNYDSGNYTEKLLTGKVTIKSLCKTSDLNSVFYNLNNNGITTDSVFLDSTKQLFNHSNNLVIINLDKTFYKGELFTITIFYHGVPSTSGFGSFNFATHGTPAQPVIYSLSEPFGTEDWFPCKNDPADKADSSDVWVTAPKGMITASNGILEDTLTQGNTTTYKWKSRYPIAPYLISILTSNFETYTTYFDNDNNHMPIENFLFPENNTIETRDIVSKTNELLGLFTEKFGTYPFINEKYGHANFPNDLSNMEHQTCSSISNFNRSILTHELAHQWFGDKITCQSWEHIWLNEGFATYAELVELEEFKDESFFKSVLYSVMASAKTAQGSIYVEQPEVVEEIFDTKRSYHKGAIVLYMLRKIVGDTTFDLILQTYINSKHAYANATTEDFQAIAEQVCGKDLNYFFNEWIYQYNYPKYKFGWAVGDKLKDNKFPVILKINQDTNTTSLPYFTMPIKLGFEFSDSVFYDTTVFNNQQQQDFLIYTSSVPKNIFFDPDSSILKNYTTFQFQIADSLLVNINDQNIDNQNLNFEIFPNPVTNLLEIKFELPQPQQVSIKLYATNGLVEKNFANKQFITSKTNKIAINCEGLKPGIYILEVITDQNRYAQKVSILD